jgi:hypothetical protein
MQDFHINKDSVLPYLRVELINDGRYDFMKSYQFNNAIQNASVTFSMRNVDNDKAKVFKAPVDVVLASQGTCEERFILQYKWKPRDVNEKGTFIGKFEITFDGDLKEEGVTYPSGNLIVPILEELRIMVR